MKKIYLYAIALVTLVLFSGCPKVIYTIHSVPYEIPDAIGSIRIDDTYDLYVRTVSIEETHQYRQKAGIRTLKVNQAEPKITVDTDLRLIEIEYLFLSEIHGTVIYISTVADRYKKRYAGPGFRGITQPNVADFRVFLVGTIDPKNPEKFTFYYPDGQHTDTWRLHKLKPGGDRLLYSIEQKRFSSYEASFPLEDDLGSKLIFKKQAKGWRIIFSEQGQQGPPDSSATPVVQFGKPCKKNYTIGFTLDKQVITFPKKYMIYSPVKSYTGFPGT